MKKSLLLVAAAALCAGVANAERIDDAYVDNLLVNGNFEDKGYVQSKAYDWAETDEIQNLESLPGWILNTGGIWNGTVQVYEEEGDGWARPEYDLQFLLFRAFKENGWTTINTSAVGEGLEVGTEYRLDFLVGHFFESEDWIEKVCQFRLAEVDYDKEGNPMAGKEIYVGDLMETGQEFENIEYDFKAPASKVWVEFSFASKCWEGGWNGENNWMQLDNVRLFDKAKAEEKEAGIESVNADNNAPVEYFTISGIRVNGNAQLNGVYIRKQGTKAEKVIF